MDHLSHHQTQSLLFEGKTVNFDDFSNLENSGAYLESIPELSNSQNLYQETNLNESRDDKFFRTQVSLIPESRVDEDHQKTYTSVKTPRKNLQKVTEKANVPRLQSLANRFKELDKKNNPRSIKEKLETLLLRWRYKNKFSFYLSPIELLLVIMDSCGVSEATKIALFNQEKELQRTKTKSKKRANLQRN